jgi:hypothetical protein
MLLRSQCLQMLLRSQFLQMLLRSQVLQMFLRSQCLQMLLRSQCLQMLLRSHCLQMFRLKPVFAHVTLNNACCVYYRKCIKQIRDELQVLYNRLD